MYHVERNGVNCEDKLYTSTCLSSQEEDRSVIGNLLQHEDLKEREINRAKAYIESRWEFRERRFTREMTMEKFDARLIIQPAQLLPGPNFRKVQSWIPTTSRSRNITTGIFLPEVANRADVGSFRNLLRPTKLFRNRETS